MSRRGGTPLAASQDATAAPAASALAPEPRRAERAVRDTTADAADDADPPVVPHSVLLVDAAVRRRAVRRMAWVVMTALVVPSDQGVPLLPSLLSPRLDSVQINVRGDGCVAYLCDFVGFPRALSGRSIGVNTKTSDSRPKNTRNALASEEMLSDLDSSS